MASSKVLPSCALHICIASSNSLTIVLTDFFFSLTLAQKSHFLPLQGPLTKTQYDKWTKLSA